VEPAPLLEELLLVEPAPPLEELLLVEPAPPLEELLLVEPAPLEELLLLEPPLLLAPPSEPPLVDASGLWVALLSPLLHPANASAHTPSAMPCPIKFLRICPSPRDQAASG
jgi:hypothetical protein